MKKIFYCLIVITLLVLPFGVFGATAYDLKDINISFDDSEWAVLTRDNLLNNPILHELEISYDYMNNFMQTEDVYLDACKFDMEEYANTLEVFVVIKEVGNYNNLHTYSARQINEVGEELKKKLGADSFDIYTPGDYKYIHLMYYDKGTSYNIDEYYTVINGYGYTVLAQKTNNFTGAELAEIRGIVDTARFKYNADYEKVSKDKGSLGTKIIVGAIVGGILGGLSALFALLSKKKKTAKAS